MMDFDDKFFAKINYPDQQIGKYFKSAEHNLQIAEAVKVPEVTFKFSYDALLKLGITLIASKGYKVKSRAGHHIKILEAMADILNNEDIIKLGDRMRLKRNKDLYGEGIIVSKKEADEYCQFIQKIFKEARKVLFD